MIKQIMKYYHNKELRTGNPKLSPSFVVQIRQMAMQITSTSHGSTFSFYHSSKLLPPIESSTSSSVVRNDHELFVVLILTIINYSLMSITSTKRASLLLFGVVLFIHSFLLFEIERALLITIPFCYNELKIRISTRITSNTISTKSINTTYQDPPTAAVSNSRINRKRNFK